MHIFKIKIEAKYFITPPIIALKKKYLIQFVFVMQYDSL